MLRNDEADAPKALQTTASWPWAWSRCGLTSSNLAVAKTRRRLTASALTVGFWAPLAASVTTEGCSTTSGGHVSSKLELGKLKAGRYEAAVWLCFQAVGQQPGVMAEILAEQASSQLGAGSFPLHDAAPQRRRIRA